MTETHLLGMLATKTATMELRTQVTLTNRDGREIQLTLNRIVEFDSQSRIDKLTEAFADSDKIIQSLHPDFAVKVNRVEGRPLGEEYWPSDIVEPPYNSTSIQFRY